MADQISSTVTSGGIERVARACEVYSRAFKTDAVFAYILQHLSDEDRIAFLPHYFEPLMKASAMADGVFDETDDFKSMTVLIPPGKKMDNYFRAITAGLAALMLEVGPRSAYRMMVEWSGKAAAAKKRGLNGHKKFWYVFFVGTEPASQGKGLGARLVLDAMRRAQTDNVPAWIEATSEGSSRLYARCGFELVEIMMLGKGRASPDGKRQAGGEGVPVWAMVWWPKKNGPSSGLLPAQNGRVTSRPEHADAKDAAEVRT